MNILEVLKIAKDSDNKCILFTNKSLLEDPTNKDIIAGYYFNEEGQLFYFMGVETITKSSPNKKQIVCGKKMIVQKRSFDLEDVENKEWGLISVDHIYRQTDYNSFNAMINNREYYDMNDINIY